MRTKGSCSVHLVPYSEHSSYDELLAYVRALRPHQVTPRLQVSQGFRLFAGQVLAWPTPRNGRPCQSHPTFTRICHTHTCTHACLPVSLPAACQVIPTVGVGGEDGEKARAKMLKLFTNLGAWMIV